MPKVSVYLPDELYRAAKENGLPLSTLMQEAVERVLQDKARHEWVALMRSRPRRVHREIDVQAVMDEVREEFGT